MRKTFNGINNRVIKDREVTNTQALVCVGANRGAIHINTAGAVLMQLQLLI